MKVQIKTWGNSQGVQIPKEILQDAGIALNDILDISVSDGIITLKQTFQHRTLEERAAEMANTTGVNLLVKKYGNIVNTS